MIGRRLSHYRVVAKIGAGGMGVVYQARDETLDRDVAVKILPAGALADEAVRRRFRKEALALAKLNHPNIETVYDFASEDGLDFLVTEYVPGRTLAERITGGPLPETEITRLGGQIAAALEEAEERGLVHLDLKPRNLMLTPKGQIKLLDFGLARFVRPGESDVTQTISETLSVAGTPPYMAPEQLLGGPLDVRTDIYGAGATLYEMATGRPPFRAETSPQLIGAILHTAPVPPRSHREELSPGLDRLILKCLEKEPGRRYQSARQLSSGIEDLTATKPLATDLAYVPGRHWLRPKVWPHPFVAAGFLTAVSIFILFLWFAGSRPALSFALRDWVLVTDFENQTGDPLFDRSLLTAFTASLEQSRYANVYPRARIRETLARMKKPPGAAVDEVVGHEVAVRDGIKALIVPSLSGVGDDYRLAARIHETSSGNDIKTIIVKAKGKNRILDALDQLAAKVRRDLGESRLAISRTSRPLATVTTASLEALKQYSVAIEKHLEGNVTEAKLYYENALRMDPAFTAARGSLGMLLFEHFDSGEGRRLLSGAVRNTDNLTDREKYGLLAFHAQAVEKNLEQSVRYQKTLIGQYPDFSIAHNNLGVAYREMGRCEEAAAEFKECIRIDPRPALTSLNLITTYVMCSGDLDAAIAECKTLLGRNDRDATAYGWLGYAYLGKGRLDEAEQALRRAVELNPKWLMNRYNLAVVYLLQARKQDAAGVLNGIVDMDPTECWAYYYLGVARDLAGEKGPARAQWKQAAECRGKSLRLHPDWAFEHMELAVTLARLGEMEQAEVAARKALSLDSGLNFEAARFRAVEGKPEEAVDYLEAAEKRGYRNYVWVKAHPDLQSLSAAPRFVALVGRHLKGLTPGDKNPAKQ